MRCSASSGTAPQPKLSAWLSRRGSGTSPPIGPARIGEQIGYHARPASRRSRPSVGMEIFCCPCRCDFCWCVGLRGREERRKGIIGGRSKPLRLCLGKGEWGMRSRAAREDGDWRASVYSVPVATKRFRGKKRLQKKPSNGTSIWFFRSQILQTIGDELLFFS